MNMHIEEIQSLQGVRDRITAVHKQIQTVLQTLSSPNGLGMTQDQDWGTRFVSLSIRLDEFDLDKLEAAIAELKRLHGQYRDLRAVEARITFADAVDRSIQTKLNPF